MKIWEDNVIPAPPLETVIKEIVENFEEITEHQPRRMEVWMSYGEYKKLFDQGLIGELEDEDS